MSKLETNTIDNISGSSTLTIGDSNASTISIPKNITLGASGTTITVPSGATITNNGTQTGFGGTNTPNFKVSNTSNQSLSNATLTKLTFDTEDFDSDNAFASNKFTVPSGKAGKYAITFQVFMEGTNDIRVMRGYVYKNGSALPDIQSRLVFNSNLLDAGSPVGFIVSGVLNLSVSDYLEAYVYIYNTAGGTYQANAVNNIFQGYKIIE